MTSMSERFFVAALPLMALGLASAAHAQGNPPAAVGATLFQNVRIFDGKGSSLSAPSSVLVKGNIIERISATPIATEPGVTVIAGNGRTLMPGLIDAHWHAMLVRPNSVQAITGDVGYNNLAGGRRGDGYADARLHHRSRRRRAGVRAEAAPSTKASSSGPRIYPSGAMITVTSGHGDFRQLTDLPRTIGGMLSRMEQIGGSHGRRQSGRGARARPRATHAGRFADQADGRRRRVLAVQPARRDRLSPSPNCAPPWKRPKIGAPMSPCMPLRRRRSSGPSPLA